MVIRRDAKSSKWEVVVMVSRRDGKSSKWWVVFSFEKILDYFLKILLLSMQLS